MNKNYLLLAMMAGISTSFGQQISEQSDCVASHGHSGGHGVVETERAAPFWTEDFGSGFPAGWGLIDSSGICPWSYTFDGSWGYYNGNSATAADAGITSTTASNGYMICDNDSANHFTYGQPSGTTYQYLSSWMGTSAIDCSTHPSVILRFQQFFRYNNGVDLVVQVSNDSVAWTSYDVSGGVANNTYSADPDNVILNVSPVAGSQATVYFRFGWSARVYFWCIDDISLSEAEPNDVIMENGYWEAGSLGYQHYKIPMTQLSPVTFFGAITNNTGGTLNDVYFDIDLDEGGSVFSGTSGLLDLTATETDTASVSATYTPVGTGFYTATYTAAVTSAVDGDLTNNEYVDGFEVTSSIYGLDNLNDPSESTGNISNWSGNTGMEFAIGNLYEIIEDDALQCVEIGVADDATNEGEVIFGAAYYWDGSAWSFLEQTDDYVVGPSDYGAIVSLPFDAPVDVSAGMEVVVLAGHYGGTDCSFMFAQPVRDQMVWGYDGTATWYWLSSPRAVVDRANFQCGIGFDENQAASGISVYPNPATDIVNVSINLSQISDVVVDIVDVTGKVVSTMAVNQLAAGEQKIPVAVENLSRGTYMAEIFVNGSRFREKVVIH
jgi:hypothetical protein